MDKADDSISFVSLAQVIFLDYSFTLLDDIKLWLRGRSGLGRLSSLAGRRVGRNGSVALRHIVIEIKDGPSLLGSARARYKSGCTGRRVSTIA